jgi:serine/threonine-protein kinase HipA
MNPKEKCLACYRPLDAEQNYHAKCCKAFFGKPQAPVLPYALNQLEGLAEKLVRSSITVPGVQEKISLHIGEGEGAAGKLTLVGLWGDYILKPPVRRYPEMPEVEDLTMHLASLWNIKTVPHCLIRLRSGELAYITKRIDRAESKKTYHMEDMCQLTGRLTEQKYRSSMETIGKAIRQFSSHPLFDIITFFDTALFCFIIGNADMHLKNFSLFYQSAELVQLSPAYDLLSTRLLITEKDDSDELALTLNGKRRKLKRHDFDTFALTIGMNAKQAANAYARAASNIASSLSFITESFISNDKKSQLVDLIEYRAERLSLRDGHL